MFKIHNVKFKSTADLKTFLKRDLNTLLDTLYSKPDKEEYYAAVEDVIIALADIKVKDLKYEDFLEKEYSFIHHFTTLQFQHFKRLFHMVSMEDEGGPDEYSEIKNVFESEDGRLIMVKMLHDIYEPDPICLTIRPALIKTRLVTEYVMDTQYQD